MPLQFAWTGQLNGKPVVGQCWPAPASTAQGVDGREAYLAARQRLQGDAGLQEVPSQQRVRNIVDAALDPPTQGSQPFSPPFADQAQVGAARAVAVLVGAGRRHW